MFTSEAKPEGLSGGIAADALQTVEDRFLLGNDISDSAESQTAAADDFIGLGMSIGIHAVFVLSFLMLAAVHASRSAFEAPVVFVNLTQAPEGVREGGGVLHPDAAEGGALPSSGASSVPGAATVIPAVAHNVVQAPKVRPHVPAMVKRRRKTVSSKPHHAGKTRAGAEDMSPSVSHVQPMTPATAAYPDSLAANSPPPSPVPASLTGGPSAGDAGAASGRGDRSVAPTGGTATGHGHGAGAGNGVSKGSGGGTGGGSGSGTGGGMGGEFSLNQVDQAPTPIRKVTPEFPEAARKLGASGKVLLKFLVKADGSVTQASVVTASPKGLFDGSALKAVCQWRFTPGIYHGHAVATWVMLPVNFRLSR